jgi:UrcA family protein
MNKFARFAFSPLVAFALGMAAQPAQAGEQGDVAQRVVRYSELDLGTSEGARRLYLRIRASAEAVCRPQDGAALERKLHYAACRKVTIDRAVQELDAPLVTAQHVRRQVTSLASASR